MSDHVTQVFAGGLVSAVQQLEALENECRKLRVERDALRVDLAAARAECVRRQTIIGEVALERDAARARLDSVAERDRLAIAAVEGVQQMRIDLAAARALLNEAQGFIVPDTAWDYTTDAGGYLYDRIDAALKDKP